MADSQNIITASGAVVDLIANTETGKTEVHVDAGDKSSFFEVTAPDVAALSQAFGYMVNVQVANEYFFNGGSE